jgi:hypothetical protein
MAILIQKQAASEAIGKGDMETTRQETPDHARICASCIKKMIHEEKGEIS